MGVLMTAKLYFEKSELGHFVHQELYKLVQVSLNAGDTAKRISVVDLGDNISTPFTADYTSRPELLKVIDMVAATHPCAIGLDIDFDFMIHPLSPKQREADVRFLRDLDSKYGLGSQVFECEPGDESAMRSGRHIFLGAHGAIALGKYVFGDPRFASYAAFIGFPDAEDGGDLRTKMVQSAIVTRGGVTASFPSLSVSVANTYLIPPRLLGWGLDLAPYVPGGLPHERYALPTTQFWINYQPLADIEKRSILHTHVDQQSLAPKSFVLIGRGRDYPSSADQYVVPGFSSDKHAGVYIHACAIYTLLTGGLIALSAWGESVLDAVATFFVIGGVAVYSWRRSELMGRNKKRVSLRATWIASLLVFLLAVLLARVGSGVLWDGFAIVIATLWLHWLLEDKWELWRERIAHRVSKPRQVSP